jgi:hypothetical protein
MLSHTVLGKGGAVLLILFYGVQDIFYGIFVCLLVILYYQSEFYETMIYFSPKEESVSHSLSLKDEYCVNGTLTFKNMEVKPEMSEHVFPEIQFENGESCNICDSACKFVV